MVGRCPTSATRAAYELRAAFCSATIGALTHECGYGVMRGDIEDAPAEIAADEPSGAAGGHHRCVRPAPHEDRRAVTRPGVAAAGKGVSRHVHPAMPAAVACDSRGVTHGSAAPADVAERPLIPLLPRILIVAVGALVIWLVIAALGTALWGEEMSLSRHVANALVTCILAILLVVSARRLLDRRPVVTLGLPLGLPALRDLLCGVLTWLLPAAAGVGVALVAGWLRIEIEAALLDVVGAVLLLTVLVFVYEAFPEELIFRGYIYRNLAIVVAPWLAVLMQALTFAAFGTALWVVGSGWEVLAERFVLFLGLAVVTGCLRLIAGTVWAGMGFHLAFQVTMQLFLSGRYLDVALSDEMVFVVATAVVAFASAVTIAGTLWRGPQNWSHREPEPPAGRPSVRGS